MKLTELTKTEQILHSTFVKLNGMTSIGDLDHFKSLSIKRMIDIIALLKSGFSLKQIKGYSIWTED